MWQVKYILFKKFPARQDISIIKEIMQYIRDVASQF